MQENELADRGNPEVIAALNNAYRPALTAFEEFHRQEHRFAKRYRYKKMAKRYDKLVDHAHHVRHKILNRIEHLGGEVDSEMDPINVADSAEKAYENTHKRLDELHGRIGQAIAVAQSANDHVTHSILLKLTHKISQKKHKVRAHQRQLKDLNDMYLVKEG